ncbi:gamma-tubulin complex component 5 [Solenopsis invicta]|uniref:gamma-tubulin complex component 5 n=1 Tax=Solenopsis invicta TaxID=13686 RepID=UPI00059623BE|nr:gamma-tubulin complex component 5 [Solenopsis invicta]XP_039308950.1 gamma-tubulin complex component 5 [Solenopsis invicta]
MSTRILNDIHNDLKRLITALTLFEEDEEGFRICERFCLSNIKHHRYLSVNSHETKEAINALITKFSIHGKYEVAKTFQELIDSFLSSFDFEQHPQYDLQWYLLTFLLDLATETNKSNLDSLKLTRGEHSFNAATGNEDSITEEIDWAQYLKEGQENFFCDYKSDDSESEWSDLSEEEGTDENDISLPVQVYNTQLDVAQPPEISDSATDKFSLALMQDLESRKWLSSNVQTDWWNNLKCLKYPIVRRSCDTSICDIWHETKSTSYKVVTLSEYQVCRELLWMFYVQTSMVVFQQDSQSKFSICADISIPSLTTTAFESILAPFCKYYSMMYDMERFGGDLQPIYNQESELQNPPLTYEAYNAALRQHLYEFKTEVINMEKDIMKQENCNTFLSLSSNLRRHLNTIKILYDIHRNIIIDWKVSPNWKCASRLLSSLYYEMQNSHNRERTNICINLYLCSLTVYLNIIDTWLSKGRLEDWRDEFIIARVSEDKDEQTEKFTIRLSDDICSTDPIMQFLLQKVQHMGHSIELLVSLDRIADIWRMDDEDIRNALNIELQNKLLSEISKYSPSVEETDIALQIDKISLQEHDADIEKNIIQQLSAMHNPFFIKAMEEYMPCELYKNDTVDARMHNTHNSKAKQGQIHNLYKELQKITYILPMQNILENTLSEILILRYNSASKLVKNIMIEEYKLQTHLKLLRFVYMMEAGHVMNKFYQILFHEIENNQMWANSYFLSCIVEEVFSQYWPDTSSRWSITVHGNITTRQVLQAVNSITLNYTVEWPISLVLTKKVLEKYNEIFRFQLKLKWALWTLNNLRFGDLEGSRSPSVRDRLEQFHIRRLECLRFWLLHAIGSIHTYLSGQVLQSLGFILEKILIQADSLDTIISVHNEYLNKVHEHCLLTEEFEDLMTTINNMIEMCIHIRDRWSRKKLLLAATELDVMEHSYIKYHTYLALALHNAVQHKDADYLTALSSAFNCSMPCT